MKTNSIRKFEQLINRQSSHSKNDKKLHSKRIYNISSKKLSETELQILSKGLNFAPTPNHIPKNDYILNLEPTIQLLPQESQPNLRFKLMKVLNKNVKIKPNLSKEEFSALTHLCPTP